MADIPEKKGYRIDYPTPNDNQVERGRFGRLIVLLCYIAFVWLGCHWLLSPLIRQFPHFGMLVQIAAIGIIFTMTIPGYFLVSNPEWSGYVTQNMFGKNMVAYGPALHVSYPWEDRDKSGNYPLTIITREFSSMISTLTSAVTIQGVYEYAISLRYIRKAIGSDKSTIQEGLTAFIESCLTSLCSAQDVEWVRKNIDKINAELATRFMQSERGGDDPKSLEATYGFKTVSVVVNRISLPATVQKTRDAKDEAKELHAVVAEMYGMTTEELKERLKKKPGEDGYISKEEYDKMLNRAMAASDNAKMNINVVEGNAAAIIANSSRT